MLALGADVAIILHVAAVELDQLRVGLADGAGQRVGEAFHECAAQAARRLLDGLDGRLGFAVHGGRIQDFSRHRVNTVRQR